MIFRIRRIEVCLSLTIEPADLFLPRQIEGARGADGSLTRIRLIGNQFQCISFLLINTFFLRRVTVIAPELKEKSVQDMKYWRIGGKGKEGSRNWKTILFIYELKNF